MKKKNLHQMIKKFERLIDEQFAKCPFDKRTGLFLELEKWANNELNKECCDIFLKALYNAECTQDIQITIAFEKAIGRITK